MAAMGWTSVTFLATGNSTLQLTAAPSMRGRVMALWAVAFMGSTPVGGPLIGWIVSLAGARVGLAVGGASCLVAAGIGLIVLARLGMLHGPAGEVGPPPKHAPMAVAELTGDASEAPSIAV